MGAGDVVPGLGLVHESARSRVIRISIAGRPVIRKEPLGPDAEHRLRYEAAILKRLHGVAGVAQLLEVPDHRPSIVMADAGATSAAALAAPLDVDELQRLGLALARAVAGMHARGVMHRDLSPANIMVSAAGEPCLISFGLATSLAEIRPEFTHYAEMVGTLAYVAPEQTGRTARSVDQRADLYALGATLYELATGAPPFGTGGPLRLTHDHLAREPTPPAIPSPLSEIIMRLLEKEPDRRYQSAAGLVYDLERARDGALQVGAHDVPPRLRPPSRLAGRDAEVAALGQAFADALASACRGVLISGASGVGKSALVDELRPMVADARGWFVAGKFDQYRRDLEFDAINQTLRALGRLLLAEPEAELAGLCARILAAVGANAALLSAIVPEFAVLLGVPPDGGDPLTAQPRAQRLPLQVLRAVASPQRPLVVVVDDLQWAGRTPLGAIDLLLSEQAVDGLLLVAAYRDGARDAAHPPAASLSRWRAQPGVRHLRLSNLPAPSLVTIVADMLHAGEAAVADLVEVIEPQTHGNPYETVELLDALRRDGVLTATAGGWRWKSSAVRAHLGHAEGHLEAMPVASRAPLEAMACLGGRTELAVLATATGESAAAVELRLAPALEEGLLVMEPGTEPALRFRHDRIREAILERVDPPRRAALQLAMARRLTRVPERFATAAEQYLPLAGDITDAEERQAVVALLRRAADEAALIGDYARVDALLAAALPLIDSDDVATVAAVRTRRQAALFGLGRLDEADEDYRAIERLAPAAPDRAEATAVQVRSLSHRLRFADAIELGLEALRECGFAGPAGPTPGEPDRRFEPLHRWLDATDVADDLARPVLSDPGFLAASRLIDALLPVGYFVPDPVLIAWLGLEALRIWTEHGPSSALVGPISHAAYHAGLQTGDVALGYRALRRILELGEARGYEPGTSQARHMYAAVSCWFEPIEHGVRAAQRAREGLIAGADLAYAGYTYQLAVPYLADCAPSLERFAAEVDAGMAFLRRTGDEQTGQWLDGYEWLARLLRGETIDALPVDRYADNPLPLLYAHLNRALAAAIFGDTAALAQHSAAAMPLLAGAAGSYATAVGYVLRGLAIAEQARATDGDERAGLLSDLDEVMHWLAARAAHAPENFLHVLHLIEAEREWAAGDFRAALLAFDGARREVASRQRPWHRALIAEHAARFHVAHGLEHAAHDLLAQARQEYGAWGATAKVAQLDWAYPAPGPRTDVGRVTTGTIDLLGIVSASQALSSETSFGRLHVRVAEVLGAMTGATRAHLLLLGHARGEWLRPAPDGGVVGVDDTEAPMSVLRYTLRTGEPLLVADATSDDRFARDPYLAGVDGCSLLALPIVSRGTLRAALVLENRLIRGAFSAERLEAVKLISGQLAVSLDNAGLYAELTTSRARIVAAADEARRRLGRDLHDGAQQQLVQTIMTLQAAQQGLSDDAADADALLVVALDSAERAMSELRELAHGILPSVLTHGGLRAGVRAMASRQNLPVDVDVGRERLPPEFEASGYFIVAEALTNVVKHAGATRAAVRAAVEDGVVVLEVRDDGVGGADPDGHGLVGIADRVDALGGQLRIETALGAGTVLTARLPLPARP
jgi:signal transduction histidine kinase